MRTTICFRTGRVVHAGTFNGNPIGTAAALATLDALVDDDGEPLRRLTAIGQRLMRGIRQAAAAQELPTLVQGPGPVFYVWFTDATTITDYASSAGVSREPYARFAAAMLAHGVRVIPGGRWYVSCAHTEEDIDRTCEAVGHLHRTTRAHGRRVRMRVAVGSIMQETNTFCAVPATLRDFAPYVHRGEAILSAFEKTRTPIGGFLDAARTQDLTVVPTFSAHAVSSGLTEARTFEALVADLIGALKAAGPVDGVLLALHGAMVCGSFPDADGETLRRLRCPRGSGAHHPHRYRDRPPRQRQPPAGSNG